MPTIDVAKALENFSDTIEMALCEPIRISSEYGTVIMVSEEEWENILETIHLMGVPGLEDDIKDGRQMSRDELIRWKSSDV